MGAGSAGWHRLVNGGPFGEYVLVIPHKNWANFEDKPNVKPFWDMVKEGLGPEESESLMQMFGSAVAGGTSEILEFRPPLSYLPGK